MPSPNAGPAEAEIMQALRSGSPRDWEALQAAADALSGETGFATWFGGTVVGDTNGEEGARPERQMPYPVYTEPVQNVVRCFGALGLFVPFDWVHWEDLPRYRDHPAELATAPVSDAVRIMVAVQRSERFNEGSLEGALEIGLVQAALARLLRWYEEEASATP